MNRYVTVGLGVLAGAALFEAAPIPGIVIGGAAVLAPRYLPRLGRRLLPAADRLARPQRGLRAAPSPRHDNAPPIRFLRCGSNRRLPRRSLFASSSPGST
jgi:hypothetical protein